MSRMSGFVVAYDVPELSCRTRKTWKTRRTRLALQTDRQRAEEEPEQRPSPSKPNTSSPFLCWFGPPSHLDSRQSRKSGISLTDTNTRVISSENLCPEPHRAHELTGAPGCWKEKDAGSPGYPFGPGKPCSVKSSYHGDGMKADQLDSKFPSWVQTERSKAGLKSVPAEDHFIGSKQRTDHSQTILPILHRPLVVLEAQAVLCLL